MWIFTKYGFFSAVCARKGDGRSGQPVDTDRIMVRARNVDHLKSLKRRFPQTIGDSEILITGSADYGSRIFVARTEWSKIVAELAAETDYDNFKSEVSRTMGTSDSEYYGALHNVWDVLHRYQN